MDRFPTKLNSLAHLKKFMHDEIETIIDVGIFTGTPELMKVFKYKKHVLVEPISGYFSEIHENYSAAGISYDLLPLALSNKKARQKLKTMNHLPSVGEKYGGVTASNLVFDEDDILKPDEILVATDTLDNVKSAYQGPFLLKIDVDGAEFQILEGLTTCDDVAVIVVESWLPRLVDFIRILSDKGFQIFDITDFSYMRGQLSQMDLTFVNNKYIANPNYKEISPRSFGFTSGQPGNYFSLTEGSLLNNSKKIDRINAIAYTGVIEE